MINYIFILIFVASIFLLLLPKLRKYDEFRKINKSKFLKTYIFLFIFSLSTISVTYHFLGSPNISNSLLKNVKEKKYFLNQKEKEKIAKIKNDLKTLDKMLSKDPNNLNLLLAKASMSAIIMDIKTEINTLKNILTINPNSKVKSLLAQAYLRNNNGIVNESIKKLTNQVLSEEPEDPGANYILAKYLKQHGNIKESKNLLLKISKTLDVKGPWIKIYKDTLEIQ